MKIVLSHRGADNCRKQGLYLQNFSLQSRNHRNQSLLWNVLVAQLCLTLCDPMDCSPPGSSFGILQARILEWVAIPSSRRFPNPEIEPGSPAFQADSLPSDPQGKPNTLPKPDLIILCVLLPKILIFSPHTHKRQDYIQMSLKCVHS